MVVCALTTPSVFSMSILQQLVKLCTQYGVSMDTVVLVVVQLGSIPKWGLGYMVSSLKAHSVACKGDTCTVHRGCIFTRPSLEFWCILRVAGTPKGLAYNRGLHSTSSPMVLVAAHSP